MDCGVGEYEKECASTCGPSALVAFVFFSAFVMLAAFVLLQLVIAVLMEQLSASEDDNAAAYMLMPGAKILNKSVFHRMYRRLRFNSARKLKHRKKQEKRPSRSTKARSSLAQSVTSNGTETH
mmetsp:Transcript_24751/g.38864  ORF Transcript_24751/g.38864 Transcript_24751/m.38864 type:complete len:123 (+) Transcript_24751:3-371(+)